MRVYVNGEQRDVAGGATVAELVGVRTEDGSAASRRGIAVALDGAVVPRAEHASTVLHEGARIEIVTAVQGG